MLGTGFAVASRGNDLWCECSTGQPVFLLPVGEQLKSLVLQQSTGNVCLRSAVYQPKRE